MIIHVEDLTKRFGNTIAVDRISFDIDEGEIFGFLGPNGAGKTTTIKMLTTVSSISSGSATVGGHSIEYDPSEVRRRIGVVPQDVTLDSELKGIENLELAAKLHHVPMSIARSRAKDMLSLVELESFAEKRVSMYSGGMKRRLQLATALIHKPEVLFLDEPTVGLDVQTRTNIWNYLRKLNKEEGLTIFLTTHYLEEADQLSDRIAIMDHGTIRISGSPAELKEGLHGDVITLELSSKGATELSEFLNSLEDVVRVERIGASSYRMRVLKAEPVLSSVISAVTSRNLKIKEISLSRPTMDQVFLEVTGRSMRDTDGEEAGRMAAPSGGITPLAIKSDVKKKRGE